MRRTPSHSDSTTPILRRSAVTISETSWPFEPTAQPWHVAWRELSSAGDGKSLAHEGDYAMVSSPVQNRTPAETWKSTNEVAAHRHGTARREARSGGWIADGKWYAAVLDSIASPLLPTSCGPYRRCRAKVLNSCVEFLPKRFPQVCSSTLGPLSPGRSPSPFPDWHAPSGHIGLDQKVTAPRHWLLLPDREEVQRAR